MPPARQRRLYVIAIVVIAVGVDVDIVVDVFQLHRLGRWLLRIHADRGPGLRRHS